MRKRLLTSLTLPTVMTLVGVGASAHAQSMPSQTSRPLQDKEASHQELSRFDQFLDDHREIADQLRKDPSLVNNDEYLKDHPALQTYLQDHPGIREQIKQNPNAFTHEEARYESREDNRDREANRQELAHFDQFLDSHRETAEQLRKDPSLVNNDEFVKNHPALQAYLQDHPQVRQDIKENPNVFMHEEARYEVAEDRHDREANRQELARFDQFLDSHREIAEQLRRDPSLANKDEFVKNHPALQNYLQAHPEVRQDIKENPNAFMHEEARYESREDNHDRDRNRQELARFDQFLDSHHEIAEQLRKDPSLVNKDEFVKSHPVLEDYLQAHPEVRQDVKENPNAFMQQEARYDHREDGMDLDRGVTHRESANFGEFLGGHSNIAQQLSKDPSLVKNQEYMQNHPELQEYLSAHPEVRQKLMANPQGFVSSAQQFSHGTNSQGVKSPSTTVADPNKPKQ
jgi:hypothetical protein